MRGAAMLRGASAWGPASALIGTLALIACCSAKAAVEAPPPVQREIEQARLAGEGEFRWFGLSIYRARLWVGRAGYRAEVPAGSKFALELRYARALEGARIARSSEEQMRALGLGSAAQRAAWLARMTELFPDVQADTRIVGVHLPQLGARFYLNGKLLGEVADPDFGRAFFAIWLDPKTSAPDLRDALLQNVAPLE
ncbi:MAG: chalcone isomerase family protein [Burkholderiaceae bacterium]